MPILNVSVSGQADPALSRSIATALSEAAAVHLHKDPGVTAVVIRYIAPESWFVGGDSLTGQGLKSFHLDIKVTAGTNTKVEMADYVEAVFRTMNQLHGPLHDASYIVVHEVPAAAWGFAGKTQEHRFIVSKIKTAA
jgi:4-oxalocrotonate tautomerase